MGQYKNNVLQVNPEQEQYNEDILFQSAITFNLVAIANAILDLFSLQNSSTNLFRLCGLGGTS